MKNQIEKRIIEEAKYIIENPTTVRNMAKVFTVSKSTIHFDLTYRLSKINHKLFLQVYDIIQNNKNESHIRGGEATKQKYLFEKD